MLHELQSFKGHVTVVATENLQPLELGKTNVHDVIFIAMQTWHLCILLPMYIGHLVPREIGFGCTSVSLSK